MHKFLSYACGIRTFWRTVKAEIFAGFVACSPLSELIRCRLKTQSRHQERKSSMAFDLDFFRERRGSKTLNPAHSRVLANRNGSGGESVWERERGEEVVEWQSLLVCRERSISHSAAVYEHPQEWDSLFILSFIHSFIYPLSILSSSHSPFQFLHCVADFIQFKWEFTCKHMCVCAFVKRVCVGSLGFDLV